MQVTDVQQIKLTPVFVLICHFFTLMTYMMQSEWAGNSPPPSWLSFDSVMRRCSLPQRDKSCWGRCVTLFFINGTLHYSTYWGTNWTKCKFSLWKLGLMRVDFFFSSQMSASVLSGLWARTECGEGGPDSAEGFQFVLTTAGLMISVRVDLRMVIYRRIKHTWRCLQTDESRVYS